MALQKTITTEHGLELTNAYHYVSSMKTNRETVSFCVITYPNKEAKDNDLTPIQTENYIVTGSSFTDYFSVAVLDGETNPIKQAYLYLKSLAKFEGSTDVLE